MIRHPNLMPPILKLLDPPHTTVKQPITPRGTPLLLARVVIIRANVVLVRRRECDWHFLERPQSEAWILAARREKLVAVEEFREIIRFHGFDDGFPRYRVDAVVQVAVHDADLVIEDHGAVAAADVVVDAGGGAGLHGERVGLHDSCNVVVAVRCLGLAGCQVTVDEAHGAVVDDEAED